MSSEQGQRERDIGDPSLTYPAVDSSTQTSHGNASGIYNNSYCQVSDSEDDCAMIAVYSHSIFEYYLAVLLMSIATAELKNMQLWRNMSIVETSCSLTLSFCSRHDPVIIEIVHQVYINDLGTKIKSMHSWYVFKCM